MGYRISYDELDSIFNTTHIQCGTWQNNSSTVMEKLNNITNMVSFSGQAAENVKSYILEVHAVAISSIFELLSLYKTKIMLYKDGYYQNIDSKLHAVIDEDELKRIKSKFTSLVSDVELQNNKIISILNGINDIVHISAPSSHKVENDMETTARIASDLNTNLSNFESEHIRNDFACMETILACLNQLIRTQTSTTRVSATAYKSGDITKLTDCKSLGDALKLSYEYRNSNVNELKAAYEREQDRTDLLIQEAADEKTKQGLLTAVAALGAVVIGTVAIVGTAGAATPAVVAGVFYVAGSCSVAYGVSNLVEAGQDIGYGLAGDPYTAAWNPICDTVFAGNEKLYNLWGSASMVVAGFAVPVNAAFNAAAAANTTLTAGQITRVVATEAVKDGIASAAGGEIGKITADLTENETLGMVAGVLGGVVTSVLLGKIDQKYNISGIYGDVKTAKIDGSEKPKYSEVDYEGKTKVNGEVRDISRKVYQNNEIDWDQVDPETGLTNKQLASGGYAPYAKDGTKIELHHLTQTEPGTMVEIPGSTHDKFSKQLHGIIEDGDSFRNDPILNKQYNNFRSKYWKWRAANL